MGDYYILDEGGEPKATDLITWGHWMEDTRNNRHIGDDTLPGGVRVSTVFLGLNHRLLGNGPPLLWETMIFGAPHDEYQERYATRAEAIAGHARALAMARERS
jgi:hypothetical protein